MMIARRSMRIPESSVRLPPPDLVGIDVNELLDYFGHAQLNNSGYPYLWVAESAKKHLSINDPFRQLFETEKIKTATLGEAVKSVSLIRNFFESYASWGVHNREACSPALAKLLAELSWFDSDGQPLHRMFCDNPLPNLLVDLLIGVYGFPCHVNARKMVRLSYTAKTMPMYTDVFILDQARYLYDLVPTLPLLRSNWNFEEQLILRICMSEIRRHAFHSCEDLFQGSALAGINEHGFHAFPWPDRETVTV